MQNKKIETHEIYVSAKVIANFFLKIASEKKRNLTNMQLQKLVYITGGFYSAFTKNALYYEPTEAWQFGPVIRELYLSLKKHGLKLVDEYIEEGEELEIQREFAQKDELLNAIIDMVFAVYGHKSGSELSNLTHKEGTPWDVIYYTLGNKKIIPDHLIRTYYENLVKNKFSAQKNS